MKKLLVICPSRARSERLQDFVDNFKKTTNPEHTELLVLLDKDDQQLKEYLRDTPVSVGLRIYDRSYDTTYTTEIINKAFYENPDYQFYSVINDDMFYLTKNWDELLSVKGKLSCGKEINVNKKYGWIRRRTKVHKGGFPFTSVIDGDLVRKVGWLQYPKLICASGDSVWYWLSRRLEVFNPIEDVEYEHRSHYFGRGEYDETAKRTDCKNHMETDYKEFIRWKSHQMMDLVKKINVKEKI